MDKLVMVWVGVQHCGDKDRGCEGCPYAPDPHCEENLRKDTLNVLRRLGGCGNCTKARYVGEEGWLHCIVRDENKRNPFGNCPSWEAKLE